MVQVPLDRPAPVITAPDVTQDFGHLVQGAVSPIFQPTNLVEVQTIIEQAQHQRQCITPRAKGYSQSGQSLSPAGIILDTRKLRGIQIDADKAQAICGTGVSWRDLVQETRKFDLLPCAMPLNLNLTIGGTLSAGGIGSNSHRYGSSTSSVVAVEAVTGKAQHRTCSRTQQTDLFEAILGGLGRCAVMGQVTLQLRSLLPQTTLYQFIYQNLEQWLQDQQWLKQHPMVGHIEGFCLHANKQGWQYKLNVAIEHDAANHAEAQEWITGLHYDAQLAPETAETVEFLDRYEPRFAAMRETGDWQLAHPWFECFLPASQAETLVKQILNKLPDCFGEGHRVIPMNTQNQPQFFMTPELLEETVLFAALPTGIHVSDVPDVKQTIEELNQLVMSAGGKRYLSGWLGQTNQRFWQAHFGPHYADWLKAKQTYDPRGIFHSVLFENMS